MSMHGFTAAELEAFYRVLDSVVCEVAERELPLSVYDMIARLFTAAELGERSPVHLRRAILRGNADDHSGSLLNCRRYGGSEPLERCKAA